MVQVQNSNLEIQDIIYKPKFKSQTNFLFIYFFLQRLYFILFFAYSFLELIKIGPYQRAHLFFLFYFIFSNYFFFLSFSKDDFFLSNTILSFFIFNYFYK